jgi:hypothetical protein
LKFNRNDSAPFDNGTQIEQIIMIITDKQLKFNPKKSLSSSAISTIGVLFFTAESLRLICGGLFL